MMIVSYKTLLFPSEGKTVEYLLCVNRLVKNFLKKTQRDKTMVTEKRVQNIIFLPFMQEIISKMEKVITSLQSFLWKTNNKSLVCVESRLSA